MGIPPPGDFQSVGWGQIQQGRSPLGDPTVQVKYDKILPRYINPNYIMYIVLYINHISGNHIYIYI